MFLKLKEAFISSMIMSTPKGVIMSIGTVYLVISLVSFVIAIIALMPSILQKKPDLQITFNNLEKGIKVIIGVKNQIMFQITNTGEITLIDEIFFCIPIKFQNVNVPPIHLHEDEFGRPLISYNIRPDICGIDYLAVIFHRYGWSLSKATTTAYSISFVPKELGTYKIPVIINARIDVSSLKFPFKYMVNRIERIRDELTIEVVSETQTK